MLAPGSIPRDSGSNLSAPNDISASRSWLPTSRPGEGEAGKSCSAKTPSQLISLDLWVSGLHASGMKILLMMAVVQSLNLVIFAWFNRVAGLRILVPRQQLTV